MKATIDLLMGFSASSSPATKDPALRKTRAIEAAAQERTLAADLKFLRILGARNRTTAEIAKAVSAYPQVVQHRLASMEKRGFIERDTSAESKQPPAGVEWKVTKRSPVVWVITMRGLHLLKGHRILNEGS